MRTINIDLEQWITNVNYLRQQTWNLEVEIMIVIVNLHYAGDKIKMYDDEWAILK